MVQSQIEGVTAEGLAFIEADGCIYECDQVAEGATPPRTVLDIIRKYEMGMSRAITRRGYAIDALNLLQRGVDWGLPMNRDGCEEVTR